MTEREDVPRIAVAVWLAMVCFAGNARASEKEGLASDAQPGLHRVGVADAADPAVAATLGYGYTEALAPEDGAHHRLSVRVAGALPVVPWLTLAPVVDARYDKHEDDSGGVIDGALAVRGSFQSGELRLGIELEPWVSGAEKASTTAKALSLDSRVLAALALGNGLLGLSAGYRLDRGSEAGQNAPELGFGDRVALGLSDFDAVIVGLGGRVFVGKTELLAEATGDLLVGGDAPPLSESPLRVLGGVRQALSKRLSAELLVEASLSKRPEVAPDSSLVPIEPRVSAFAGIRCRFSSEPKAAPPPEAPPPPFPTVAPVAPPVSNDAPLEVVVNDEQGVSVTGAKVSFTSGPTSRELSGDASGHYRDEHVPKGPGKLSIAASGFEAFEKPFELKAGTPLKLEVTLTGLPPPSQVRGVVRSFGGQGLAARVRVAPLGTEVTTDATGAFQVDVPPGSYEVTIEADGYEKQTRQVNVDPQGVVILNADLVKKGGKR
jgi:hypothetical protein